MKKLMRRTSSRRVLNLTSTKKKDTMLVLTNARADRTRPATYTTDDPTFPGGSSDIFVVPWCATARSADSGTGTGGLNKYMESSRSATTCFMRGLKEVINVQTNSDVPWQWRRIVFAVKGLVAGINISGQNFYWSNLTSNGYRRTVNEIGGTGLSQLASVLFKGQQGVDWDDPMIGPIDTRRVTLMYDKTRRLASGNSRGVLKQYRIWHPMNKNIVYDDEENGGYEISNNLSVTSKPGMGDVVVVDFFKPLGGSTVNDRLSFRPNATLYWHEK